MKYLFSVLIIIYAFCVNGQGFDDFKNKIDDFTIGVIIKDQAESLDTRTNMFLQEKLLNALLYDGMSGVYPNYTYVMFPVISVIDKEMTSTAPYYYSINIDLTLFISDFENTTTFGNYKMSLKGVGKSEIQAYQNAFKRFNPGEKGLQKFISKSKLKILDYIDRNCDLIILDAITKANAAHFVNKKLNKNNDNIFNTNGNDYPDGRRMAISMLSSIDKSHKNCYLKAHNEMNRIYKELQIESCDNFITKANAYIATEEYDQALNCILSIPSSSKCKDQVLAVLNIIKKNKEFNKKVELAFRVHKENKNINLIDAIKVIGSAYMEYLAESKYDAADYHYRHHHHHSKSDVNVQINK